MMLLERLKQTPRLKRRYGVHGKMELKFKDKSVARIYTLESPWDYNQDEKNGIVGLTCVPEGTYEIHIEESPLHGVKLPFLVNPKLNVQLKTKSAAIDRTGHALCHINDIDCHHIYGRYILIGASSRWDTRGFYEPEDNKKAYDDLMRYIEESGDKQLTIKWK